MSDRYFLDLKDFKVYKNVIYPNHLWIEVIKSEDIDSYDVYERCRCIAFNPKTIDFYIVYTLQTIPGLWLFMTSESDYQKELEHYLKLAENFKNNNQVEQESTYNVGDYIFLKDDLKEGELRYNGKARIQLDKQYILNIGNALPIIKKFRNYYIVLMSDLKE